MTKKELISTMAAKAGIDKKNAAAALDAVTGTISDALASGERVMIPGFGVFEVRKRDARVGRNPHTGEEIQISPTKAPAFKAGKALKEALN